MIKNYAKRSQKIRELYDKWLFLRNIPLEDFVKIRKMNLIRIVKPYTGLSYPRLSKLHEIASNIVKARVDGNFVECGVCDGGSAGLLAYVARHNRNCNIWLFDSWEGLPEPKECDVSIRGEPGARGMALGSEEKVRELLFEKLDLKAETIHLVKGWYDDSIPACRENIGDIALLHIDCDWYESTKLCLEELYDRVVKGGFVVIDDYGFWKGCEIAVDEFIESRNLQIELNKTYESNIVGIDYESVYFQK